MNKQTAETKPPDIGPGFEWKQREASWCVYRVSYTGKRRRSRFLPMLTNARWEDLSRRLSGDLLAVALCNWAITRCVAQDGWLIAPIPPRLDQNTFVTKSNSRGRRAGYERTLPTTNPPRLGTNLEWEAKGTGYD